MKKLQKIYIRNLIKLFSIKNIPNCLTFLRIILIPCIIILLEIGTKKYDWLALFFYVFACFSDFLDGYLARKFEIESNFGKFFDPIADKILVVSVIFIMVVQDKIQGILIYPALIIILREILVSGLRDFFSYKKENLIVTNLSKWKTLIQMTSLGFLIVQHNFETKFIYYCGFIGLTLASVLTIYTGYLYFKKNIKLF